MPVQMVDLGKKRLTSQAGRQTTPSPSPSPSDTPSANMPRVEDGAQKPSPSPCIEDDYASTCLLSLPNELLEMIAFNLPGYSHMLNFALSNKYLQSITEAAMCKKLVVSKKGIKGFLEALSRHLPLGEKVISADLGDFSCMGRLQCACPTADLEKDMVVFLTHVIASRTNHTVDWFQLRRSGQGSGPMWTAKEAFFLDALFSLCPNLKSLTVELPQAMPFDGAGPPVALSNAPVPLPSPNLELPCSPPLQGAALYLAQRNLEVLTIAEDQRWKGPQKHEMLTNSNVTWRALGKHTITLAGFRKLKKLDVPLAALGNPYSIRFLDPTATPKLVDETDEAGPSDDKKTRQEPPSLPVKVLPSTLESLYLRSCGNSTFVLLLNIAQMPAGTLQLKRIEIFLQTNAKHMILKCQAEDEDKLSYLQILSHLSRNGIRVRFYNGDQDSPINMMAELTSLYFLSPWESILISTMTIQFSEVNLRSSQHRRQSPDASRLFFKHASTHFDLFNSPTFTPHAWNNIRFFHGNLNTKLRHRKASRHRINEHDLQFSYFAFKCQPVNLDDMHAPSDDSTVAFLDAIFTIPADARKYIPPAPRRKKTKALAKTDDEYAYRTHRMAQVSGRSAKRKKPETDGHHTTTEEAAKEMAKVKAMTVTHIALCSGPVALDVTAGFEAGAWAETSWAMFLQPERRKRKL